MIFSVVARMPQFLKSRVLLKGSTLYASSELRGDMILESYVGLLRKQGLEGIKFCSPEDFDNLMLQQGSGDAVPANAVQGQALKLLRQAYEAGASDIHISWLATHGNIRLRRMGMLEETGQQLGGESAITLIRAIYQSMTEAGSPQFFPTQRQEGRIVRREFLPPTVYSVRVHTEPLECANGQGVLMTLRLLYDKMQIRGTLKERLVALGYTENAYSKIEQLTKRGGLILVAGATGHGKSTLLRHVMEAQAHETPERSFLSIEDPPEYPMQRVSQVLVGNDNEQRGRAYQLAIAGAMRSDPDVLMIGEVRYPEAAAAALDAALTGHTVWSSIHAGSALGIVDRLFSLLNAANVSDPVDTLCTPGVLAGLVYQRLLPMLCPHCCLNIKDALHDDQGKAKLLVPVLQRTRRLGVPLHMVRVRGRGCSLCHKTGIKRMVVASEVVITDAPLLGYFRNRDMCSAMTYWNQKNKGDSLLSQALRLIGEGVLDPWDAENRLGMSLDDNGDFVLGQHCSGI